MKSRYQETLEYMYAKLPMYQRIGAAAYKKDLTNTLALSQAANNPHIELKMIHIAGTNGKGTTSHIIAAGLQAQGFKVGLYTSPHYKDFRERIKINGVYIPKDYIVKFIKTHHESIESISPSFFEMTVVLAFSFFRDQNVDYAVIETGLGGRLDSTNIITPILSVITNISYDHQSMLGDTLEAIATEKAGIIKDQIPTVIGETQVEIQHVFGQKAEFQHAPIYVADQHTKIVEREGKLDVMVDGKTWIEGLASPLVGPFQQRNMITALYSLFLLSASIPIDTDKIKQFFPHLSQATKYMGRWQILGNRPLTIADSAHNEGGLRLVIDQLSLMKFQTLHIVLGFVNDKDISTILSLFPSHATYYFAKANIPRGLDAATLAKLGEAAGLHGKSYRSVRQAYADARMSAKNDDLIYIGGSIFVVAEVI